MIPYYLALLLPVNETWEINSGEGVIDTGGARRRRDKNRLKR